MREGSVALYTSEYSKWLSSKAAASEEARRTLRYVEPLSDARTLLEDFFSILLVSLFTAFNACFALV
jgi:CYTH domain-containing protein